jgi:hypothetical protein
MAQAEFHRHVGDENILPDVESALRRAAEVIESQRRAKQPRGE